MNGVARMPPFYRENDFNNPRPLFSQLVQIPKWRAAYLAHMRTMLKEFSWAKMGARIDELRKLIRPYLQADSKRIYSMQQFDDSLIRAINVGFVTVPPLQPFFQDRNNLKKKKGTPGSSKQPKMSPTFRLWKS